MRIADYLDTAAARYPRNEALVAGPTRVTYAQARRFVHAVATRLRREDALGDQAHVAIYSPNDWRVPLLTMGANRADMAWIGVHDRNSLETNAQVLGAMDCDVLFFHSSFEASVAQLKALIPKVKSWVCIDRDAAGEPSLDRWLEGCWTDFPFTPMEPARIACIAPTGGTTGPSKGAAHSHHSLDMEVVNVSSTLGLGEGTRMLTVAPLSHAAGHFAIGLLPCGGTNVILNGFSPEATLRAIQEERITHFFLPPTILYALLAHPGLDDWDLSSLTHLIVGAAPTAPEKFKEAVSKFGPVLYEAYAQSESCLCILVKRPTDYLRDGALREEIVRSAGRAIPNSRVEIMDDEGEIVPRGQPGEIVVRSSMGMLGYYKNEAATSETLRHGFLHTGDIGVMDEEGFVTIVDRKKDMIVTGGFNVFPAEVEAAINGHTAVLDCIVVGVPDEKWGEAVKAVVQLKSGCNATAEEIIALCHSRLGAVKAPKSVEFWAELPRSAVGKVLRREVRKKYWEGHWRAV
jgi:acyl-CoA synthetase (AMP-forming)/AMP-acid ligase II